MLHAGLGAYNEAVLVTSVPVTSIYGTVNTRYRLNLGTPKTCACNGNGNGKMSDRKLCFYEGNVHKGGSLVHNCDI